MTFLQPLFAFLKIKTLTLQYKVLLKLECVQINKLSHKLNFATFELFPVFRASNSKTFGLTHEN